MNRLTFRRAAALVVLVLAAACGGSPEQPAAPIGGSPAQPAAQFDAKAPDVPYIDQYSPAGKDASYDGTENCGPALLAGIAKARGETGGLTDASLINLLAATAGTRPADGTTGHGMIAALEWLGMQTGANPGGDLGWIDDELAAGHDVVANGDFYAVPGREAPGLHAGHYLAVTSLTDSQLQTFIESNPHGGFTISAW